MQVHCVDEWRERMLGKYFQARVELARRQDIGLMRGSERGNGKRKDGNDNTDDGGRRIYQFCVMVFCA